MAARLDIELTTLFIDCASGEIERRYNETRRPHPMARGRPVRDGVKAAAPYASLADAKAAGATVIAYGSFISQVIQFVILAWVVFLMVKAVNRMRRNAAPITPPPSA